jgi:hypothetical protein
MKLQYAGRAVSRTSHILLVIGTLTALVHGNQITIGQSSAGMVNFQNISPETVAFSFTGSCGQPNCITGMAYENQSWGTYSMWIAGGNPILTTGPDADMYLFESPSSLMLTVQIGSSSLTGIINLNQLSGGTTGVSTAIGSFTVLTTTFPTLQPSTGVVDFVVFLGNGNSVSTVLDSPVAGASVLGSLSSGELLIPAPEPPNLIVAGTVMLAGAGLLRRFHRRSPHHPSAESRAVVVPPAKVLG